MVKFIWIVEISRSSSGALLSQRKYSFDFSGDSGELDVQKILGCWI